MKTEAIYLKLPEKLLHGMDALIEKYGYVSRQEFVREIIRQTVVQHRVNEFHKTLAKLKKKTKIKRSSPILTKKEKNSVAEEYFRAVLKK